MEQSYIKDRNHGRRDVETISNTGERKGGRFTRFKVGG